MSLALYPSRVRSSDLLDDGMGRPKAAQQRMTIPNATAVATEIPAGRSGRPKSPKYAALEMMHTAARPMINPNAIPRPGRSLRARAHEMAYGSQATRVTRTTVPPARWYVGLEYSGPKGIQSAALAIAAQMQCARNSRYVSTAMASNVIPMVSRCDIAVV